MIKKITILFLLLLLFSVGCTVKETSVEKEDTEEKESIKGSINDLIAKGKSMKCTWDMKVEGSTSSATMFIKGEKYRQDITLGDQKTHMLSDGEYMYMWSSMQEQGTKINLEKMEELGEDMQSETDVDAAQAKMSDMDAEYDFKCLPWVVSENKFKVPSDIEFMDLTSMMEGFAEMADDPCSMCDMVPEGDAKDECLANC